MRFINWNISYAGDIESKFNYLQTVITKDSCVMLNFCSPRRGSVKTDIISRKKARGSPRVGAVILACCFKVAVL